MNRDKRHENQRQRHKRALFFDDSDSSASPSPTPTRAHEYDAGADAPPAARGLSMGVSKVPVKLLPSDKVLEPAKTTTGDDEEEEEEDYALPVKKLTPGIPRRHTGAGTVSTVCECSQSPQMKTSGVDKSRYVNEATSDIVNDMKASVLIS
jgi:hypothetical protein